MAGILLLAAWGAVTGRAAIVRHVPAARAVYAAVGWPISPIGLSFGPVRSVLAEDGPLRTLTVEGTIGNLQASAAVVPNVSLTVVDRQGAPLYRWKEPVDRHSLGAHDTVTFRARLASPPRDAHDVVVSFARAAE